MRSLVSALTRIIQEKTEPSLILLLGLHTLGNGPSGICNRHDAAGFTAVWWEALYNSFEFDYGYICFFP
jgi:hypothetical protein